MAGSLVFPEWLNSNSVRAYPIVENSSRLDSNGVFKLPDSLLVAASINVTPDYRSGTFFISSATITPDRISIELSYSENGVVRKVAVVTANLAVHRINQAYAFVGTGIDSSVVGSLTVGDAHDVVRDITGTFTFSVQSTPLEVNTICISTPALKYVEAVSSGSLVGHFDEILRLQEGTNIRLTYVDADTIRIDAISGLNLTQADQCENAILKPPCIRTINGIPPDENGNFTFEGGNCISIVPETNGLRFDDTCAQSCCGCTELENLTQSLVGLENQISTLRTNVNSVQSQVSDLLASLVANL